MPRQSSDSARTSARRRTTCTGASSPSQKKTLRSAGWRRAARSHARAKAAGAKGPSTVQLTCSTYPPAGPAPSSWSRMVSCMGPSGKMPSTFSITSPRRAGGWGGAGHEPTRARANRRPDRGGGGRSISILCDTRNTQSATRPGKRENPGAAHAAPGRSQEILVSQAPSAPLTRRPGEIGVGTTRGRQREPRVRDFGPKGRDPAGQFPPGLDSVTHSFIVRYGAEARPRRSRGHARTRRSKPLPFNQPFRPGSAQRDRRSRRWRHARPPGAAA